jgi:dTDP-glucose 4,6-dehydratase
MSQSTILITGGAGFIGSHFLSHIFKNFPDWNILLLDALTYASHPDNIPEEIRRSPRFEFWHGNVTSDDVVQALVARSDTVVHFAAESHVARSLYDNKIFFVTDVLGTQTVANAVAKYADRIRLFVHVSSSEVYGTALSNPMTEDHPLNPMSPYASAKAGADRLVYSYVKSCDVPAVIIRPFNQFGPRQHLEKVVARFITSAILDEPLTIHGDGSARRDWMYVEDTCAYLAELLTAPVEKIKGEAFNIGSGRDVDILTTARMILRLMGKPETMLQHVANRPGQVMHHIASMDKARKILRWKTPERSFEDGLKKTIAWYQENRRWWERQLWVRYSPVSLGKGKIEFQ